MKRKTTIVTVTYGNRLNYLQQLVERALSFAEIGQVLVVDNASSVSLAALQERWPNQVRIIRLERNTGSANGYAVGIEAALQSGAEYLWLMDDDNAPTAAAVQILHREVRNLSQQHGAQHVAVLGFRPTQQEDIAQGVPSRFLVQPRSSYFGFHIRQLPYKVWRRLPWGKPANKPLRMLSLPFAPYGGMLAHRSLYQRIGVPLRDLVLYADDTEYTRRITSRGGHLYIFTDALIDELEISWNTKARTRNIYETYLLGNSDFRAYYSARNQAWFDKHIWAASPWMYRLNRSIFFHLLRFVARRRNTPERLSLIEQAIRDGETGSLGMSDTFPLS